MTLALKGTGRFSTATAAEATATFSSSNPRSQRSYGFCPRGNKYNSVAFRVVCTDKKRPGQKPEVEIVGEVRLKKNKLSLALINAMRRAVLKRYKGYKRDQLLPDQPVDSRFEIYVLALCFNMLKEYYMGRHKTTVVDDKKKLMQKNISEHLRSAIIYRLEAKEILMSNLKYFEILMHILSKTTGKKDFKEIYMKQIDALETEADLYMNRRAIRKYLKGFYNNMKKL